MYSEMENNIFYEKIMCVASTVSVHKLPKVFSPKFSCYPA